MVTTPILNQAWEDVVDDVTGAIEKAVQPLLKRAVDDIYGGLLEATQDYLKDNLAFNIASRISAAEREAATARQQRADLLEAAEDLSDVAGEGTEDLPDDTLVRVEIGKRSIVLCRLHQFRALTSAVAKARGQ